MAAYRSLRVSLSSFDLCNQLADLKEVSPWLNEVDSQALQAISDVSIGEFFRQMEYKCNWYGKNLVKIGRFEPTSKTCSVCGEINETLTLTDRWWICTNCHSTHDWDLNAAKNIRRIGLIQSGEGISGEPVERWRLRRARKQEVPCV